MEPVTFFYSKTKGTNRIFRYYTYQKDFNMNKTLLIHDSCEKKHTYILRVLKDLIAVREKLNICKSRVISQAMLLFLNNLLNFEEYCEALYLITQKNSKWVTDAEGQGSQKDGGDCDAMGKVFRLAKGI